MFQKKPLVNERELSIQPGVGTREKLGITKQAPPSMIPSTYLKYSQ